MFLTRICLCSVFLFLSTRPLAAQAQDAQEPTSVYQSQQEITDLYDPVQTGDYHGTTLTGQFWYKVRIPYKSFKIEHYSERQWRLCWVYDHATCTNVARRYPVDIPRERRIAVTSHRIETRCAQVRIPRNQLANGGACDCDIPGDRRPYESQPPVMEAPENGAAAAENSASRREPTTTRLVDVSPRPRTAARPTHTPASRGSAANRASDSPQPTTVYTSAAPTTYYYPAAPPALSYAPVVYGY